VVSALYKSCTRRLAFSPQGLLNPSAATVKAPRVAAKGWTAFTAFGLHTRDAVRGANPGATSVEVEKVCATNVLQLPCSTWWPSGVLLLAFCQASHTDASSAGARGSH
jgi:hypothetical protein